MTRRTWILLLALYTAVAAAVPLVGYSLPPCFGNAQGQVSAECLAQWEAALPLFPHRLVAVLGVPVSALVTFYTLAGLTLIVDVVRRIRGRS
jgi:hypothetical protein